MRKLGLAILAVLTIGCSSLSSIFDDLSGDNATHRTTTTQEKPLPRQTPSSRTNTTQTSSLSQRTKDYVLPVSYETAYTYRTDIPDSKMRNIPRNIDIADSEQGCLRNIFAVFFKNTDNYSNIL
jgi:hypothetical protein